MTSGTTTTVNLGNAVPATVGGTIFDDRSGNGTKDTGEAGLAGWQAVLDVDGDGTYDPQTASADFTTSTVIADNATVATGLFLSGAGLDLTDLRVELDINHPNVSDLSVVLVSPAGTRVQLFANVGGTGDNFSKTVFSLRNADKGAITAGTAPFATSGINGVDSFSAQGLLGAFVGENPNGIWKLEITDSKTGNAGTLTGWHLWVNGGDTATTTDANGAFKFNSLRPGTYPVLVLPPSTGWAFVKPTGGAASVTVASGAASTGTLYAADDASISGTVYSDADSNGAKGSTEAGVAGRVVYLDLNGDKTFNTASTAVTVTSTVATTIYVDQCATIPLTVSNLVGNINDLNVKLDMYHDDWQYVSIDLASPDGTIIELLKHGSAGGGGFDQEFNFTFDDEAAGLSLANSGPTKPSHALSGFDGQKPNGTWKLLVTADGEGDAGHVISWSLGLTLPPEPTTTTDASGNFRFSAVPAGAYTVRTVLPTGWTATGNAGPSVTLAAGTDTAGELLGTHTATSTNTASITGQVFNDANGNGVKDSTDAGLGGVTVYNDANNNGKFDTGELTTVSDATGNYKFSNLAAGSYKIRQLLPTGAKQTTPTGGYGWTISLAAGQTATGKNFGEQSTATATSSISGNVFNDANSDQIKQSTEAGLNGWVVYVDANNNSALDTGELKTTTDSSGNYTFTKLAAGTYKVRVVRPTGWSQTTPTNNFGQTVTVGAAQVITGKNFGEHKA